MLHVYDGTAFTEPRALRRWDGDAWVDADGYRWDGTEWVPIFRRAIPLADDFDRPDGVLGMTSVGDREWETLAGTWAIGSGQAEAGDGSAAVVEAHTADVDISLDISTGGRDAIVFRATDEGNYWLLERYRDYSAHTTCTPVTRYMRGCYDGVACFNFFACGSCPTCTGGWTNGPCAGCGTASQQTCSDSCSTSSTYTHRVYLARVQGGTKSTVNWWSVASSLDRLRVRAVGDTIEVYVNDTTVRTVTGQTFNQGATRHGIGRGTYGNRSGTAIDNFDLTPAT